MPARNALRACLCCSLLKTPAQWRKEGCDNCPFLDIKGSSERVMECTTSTYDGAVAILKPQSSWVAKFQRLESYGPGMYAVMVMGSLPADDLAMLEERQIPLRGRGADD